jgi:hypothetical protein
LVHLVRIEDPASNRRLIESDALLEGIVDRNGDLVRIVEKVINRFSKVAV